MVEHWSEKPGVDSSILSPATIFFVFAGVAQLVEHLFRKQVVVGSIPIPGFLFVKIRQICRYKREFGGFGVESPVFSENDVRVSPVLS